MEVFARGLEEMCLEEEVQWVMQQTEHFSQRLKEAGVPIERGCDGASILAEEFFPHLDSLQQDAFSENEYPEGAQLCSKCNTAAVVMMDGCMTCLACGDSKCG